MDTIVFTESVLDIDSDSTYKVTFVGCKWQVDEGGRLHVYGGANDGPMAAFPAGTWRAVVRSKGRD